MSFYDVAMIDLVFFFFFLLFWWLEMATHSSVLAWRIPWTEEPDMFAVHRISSVGHDLATKPPPQFSWKLWTGFGYKFYFYVLKYGRCHRAFRNIQLLILWGDYKIAFLLEKGMATHSSILAQRIPWTEEPGGLQSMGSQRVRHGWARNTHLSLNI